jgi:hypothetical protein
MTTPRIETALRLFGMVYGVTGDSAAVLFTSQPAEVKQGWLKLANSINEVTGAETLEYSAKRYIPTAEEIERMSQ